MTYVDSNLTDSVSQRRAKIVATVGPASNTEPVLRELVRAGVDVLRLNFSHGSHEGKLAAIQIIRKVSVEERKPLCIIADLQGPKIRTSKLKDHLPVLLKAGQRLTITPREVPGTATLVGTTFKTLAENVEQGSRILLSDGLLELRVHELAGADVVCDVINGGMLGEHKGINLPGIPVRVPSLTDKDGADLEFALKNGVDAIAVSFVRTAEDVRMVRNRVSAYGCETWIIAKLEKPQAIEHLEEILEVADGVMIARGDLGVEMPPEKVPVIQKHVIRRCASWRRPVITATQMLESMIENPRPTRAEASDVANAIFDGTDAVMLSAETASGRYPKEAVAIMARIIVEAESNMGEFTLPRRRRDRRIMTVSESICEAVAHAAEDLHMGAIAVFTETGNTARLISKYRPKATIYAFSHRPAVCNRMNLLWGVYPVLGEPGLSAEHMVTSAEERLLADRRVNAGDVLGVVAGTQMASGSTNFMRLHTVGADAVASASGEGHVPAGSKI